MAVFGHLELEDVVQINDRTRLDASKSFSTVDEASISLVRIKPEQSEPFITVSLTDKYLDWSYQSAGSKTVEVEVTTDGAPTSFAAPIVIISESDDHLFSTDAELVPHEPDIMNWVRPGRNTYKNIHRLSQDRIVTYLDENRIWDKNGNRLTKSAVTDIKEVNDWSKFMTLMFIFEGISNSVNDVFDLKAQKYKVAMQSAQNRAALRLDLDGDTTTTDNKLDLRSVGMVRR